MLETNNSGALKLTNSRWFSRKAGQPTSGSGEDTEMRCKRAFTIATFGTTLLLLVCLGSVRAAWPQASGNAQSQSGPSLPRGKKLILKDGTFQLVKSYQVDGDRVRYYSLTQHDWEEMPVALVDWDATKKEEEKEASRDSALLEKAHEQQQAQQADLPLDVDASLEILPKIFLPPGEGMFILDNKAVYSLTQAETDEKIDKKQAAKRVLVPIPIIASRKNITLHGPHARFRITNTEPEFYLRTIEYGQPQLELVRVKARKDDRLVEHIDTTFFQQTQKRVELPLQIWQIAGGVYRFTLEQPLTPGEYALVEVTHNDPTGAPQAGPGDDGEIDLLVWDFGVNPSLDNLAKKSK